MDDLISRKWLIECVEEGWIKFETEKDENKFIHLVRDTAPSAQRWIPCSERLPKEKDAGILKKLGINTRSDIVLVTVRVKEDLIADHARTNNGIWHWELKYAFPDHEVVAWMPLPEPYKVGEKDV